MAYSLTNICTKNYWNRTITVNIIDGGWLVRFLRHIVYIGTLCQRPIAYDSFIVKMKTTLKPKQDNCSYQTSPMVVNPRVSSLLN